MKTFVSTLVLCSVGLSAHQSNADPLPGTPVGGANFGVIEISDGLTVFPGLVQPGDVILRENPLGGNPSTNWSDAIRFFNFLGFGVAYHISDGENGIPSLLVADAFGSPIQPNALSPNTVFINEIQIGTGSDALDVTPYTVAGATYNLHSDAPLPSDVPDVIPALPGGEVGPGKMNRLITLFENADDRVDQTFFAPFEVTSASFVAGAGASPIDGEDTVTFEPAVQNGVNGTLLTLHSVFENDFSDDLEPINVRGDEVMTTMQSGAPM